MWKLSKIGTSRTSYIDNPSCLLNRYMWVGVEIKDITEIKTVLSLQKKVNKSEQIHGN